VMSSHSPLQTVKTDQQDLLPSSQPARGKTASSSMKPKVDFLFSKISWKVITAVFATIVGLEIGVLYITVQNYERQQLAQLAEASKNAVTPVFYKDEKTKVDVINTDGIKRLIETTPIKGMAIYNPQGGLFARDVFGEVPLTAPDATRINKRLTWLSEDETRFEVSLGPRHIQAPYSVVMRIDSSAIKPLRHSYIIQSGFVALLLSLFVTNVLILVIGKWLLEPILLLRDNLLRAARDPAHPDNYQTHYKRKDELGSVIASANKLIRQNAENISRLNQQAQDKIFRLAYYDVLTELPNRAHFMNKLDNILENRSSREALAVMVVDIDNFGDVNDTLGYEAGDKVLKMISDKLNQTLINATMIARLGEDEFAAIFSLHNDHDQQIRQVVNTTLGIFEKPFLVQENDLVLEACIGIALWPNDADKAIDLLKKAENALDQAKLEQKDRFCLYTSAFDHTVQARIQMIRDLRIAIDDKQFALVFQPQIDAKTKQLIGAEALLRWEKPDPDTGKRNFIRPDHFIPVAEQSGLIVPIGRWVIEEACRFAREATTKHGIPPFRVAVNMSGIQMQRDNIVEVTRQALTQMELAPHLLELEVTESAVMKDMEDTIRILQQLNELGIELAIDDFGTGYSSLSYLKKFPIHRLKIDRSFIMNAPGDKDDAAITRTIINLGHSLDLKVIAEGVETIEQVEFLSENNCDEFQGYYFSKPLPPAEFYTFARSHAAQYQNTPLERV
jgi:diguanylate cyclase (GGDEF)-like protein